MKYSIGEKQVKVVMMKKFLIFIFTMFGLMLGMLAMMYNEYIRAYEAAHHRSSFPEPKENLLVPVSTRAYAKAKSWSEKSPLSKQQIKIYLTKYGMYSEYISQSAVNKLNIDWKEQAVLAAKSLQKYRYSKEKLVEQLINVALFTQEEADYAIEQGNFDWKEEAVKEAESYVRGGKITKEKMLEILVENKKFTQEEAEYAIEHAKIDLLD